MKHKPFEEWIFTDDSLPQGDPKILYEHLRDCDHCYLLEKNWRHVERLITAAPLTAPAGGFAERWQIRLEQDKRRAARRRRRAALGAAGASAALFSLLFGLQFLEQSVRAIASLSFWASSLGWMLSAVQSTESALSQISAPLSPVMPTLMVMAFFAALGAGALLWLKMFRMLARIQGYREWA